MIVMLFLYGAALRPRFRGFGPFLLVSAMRHAFGVRVQKVQRVLRVQKVVVSPTAMSIYGCSAALVGVNKFHL